MIDYETFSRIKHLHEQKRLVSMIALMVPVRDRLNRAT